jgi:S1-C subfamily serine protease
MTDEQGTTRRYDPGSARGSADPVAAWPDPWRDRPPDPWRDPAAAGAPLPPTPNTPVLDTTATPPARARRLRSGVRRAGPFVAGVAATFIAILLYGAVRPSPPALTIRDVRSAVGSALASQAAAPPPPRSQLVYEAVRPSVVLIETDGVDEAGADEGGLGTGVVVNDQGAVLTALHVVDGATTIHLTFADGTKSDATIGDSNPATDIAVLAPNAPPPGIPPATLGNPAAMQIGSEAYIVGNPFGLYGSLSSGVVSGLDRSFRDPDDPERVFSGLIQVDAAVNPGNSGGPLVDRQGRVVGIVTALINPTKQEVFIGIGLAVPIDVAGGGAGLPSY